MYISVEHLRVMQQLEVFSERAQVACDGITVVINSVIIVIVVVIIGSSAIVIVASN